MMLSKPSFIFRAVIASPSDVERERGIIREVIADVNKTLETMGRDYRIVLVEQKDVPPGIGNPERKIIEHFGIENIHIFIGIFWRRFGSPPDFARPSDNAIYLSGTQSEIDEAFAAYEKNGHLRPEIMIYRKMDPPKRMPKEENEEAIIQYANVLTFFRQLESGNKHKAYYVKFLGREFKNRLNKDLVQICSKNESRWLSEKTSSSSFLAPDRINLDPEQRWFESSPLKFNPFSETISEKVPIEEYAIPNCSISDVKRIISDKNMIYVFGDKGTGKTTLLENTLRLVENDIYQDAIQNDKIYCVRIGSDNFTKQLELIGGLSQYQTFHFTKLIYDLTTGGVETLAQRQLPKPEVDFSQPLNTLTVLMNWLRQYKYNCMICLVDGVDEVFRIKDRLMAAKQTIDLIRSIIPANASNFRLRLFLTSDLKKMMRIENQVFRLDRYRTVDLEWNEEKIVEMLNRRLQVASRTGAVINLSELCPENPNIENEMAHLARNNPRAMLWLANKLIQIHVEQKEVTEFISSVSWEKVKKDWDVKQADFDYGNDRNTFWVGLNGTPYFHQMEIDLSPILSRILCCLIEAKGSVCEHENIIQAGYPNENSKYLKKTYRQQMVNLNKKLNEIAPGWLLNVRGKGYRLKEPDEIKSRGGKI